MAPALRGLCSLVRMGGNSKVRDHFNFNCKQWDYQQEAIVATNKD